MQVKNPIFYLAIMAEVRDQRSMLATRYSDFVFSYGYYEATLFTKSKKALTNPISKYNNVHCVYLLCIP